MNTTATGMPGDGDGGDEEQDDGAAGFVAVRG